MKGSWTSAALALAVAFLMASPFAAAPSDAQTDDEPIYLRVGMLDDVRTLNPIASNSIWTWDAIRWMYDTPVYRDVVSGEPVPYIAVRSTNCTADSLFNPDNRSEWESPAVGGQMTVIYDFAGVKFHDGQQMDINDIIFSYGVAAQVPKWSSSLKCLMDDGGRETGNYSTTHWLGIKKVDANSLRFYLQEPFYNFVDETLAPIILPQHVWGMKIGGQSVDNADPLAAPGSANAWDLTKALAYANPDSIGSGPFKYENWTLGQQFEISTWHEHFYGFPTRIDGVKFKVCRVGEASTGSLWDDIDYAHWSMPQSYVPDLIKNDDIGISQSYERGFTYLGYNLRRKSFGYIDSNPSNGDYGKPLREAIAHSIDRKEITERILCCFGITADGPISPIDTEWYNNSLPQFCFDPDQTIRILTDAGYQLTNPSAAPGDDNWWKNPDGTNIGSGNGGLIEILVPPADYDPIRAYAGLMIATQLRSVGINAESIAMDFDTIITRIEEHNFDMYILGWRIESDPPTFLYYFYHSMEVSDGANYVGYQNISFDAFVEEARAAPTPAERQGAIKDCQAAIVYDQPVTVLYYRTNIEAYVSSRFINWTVGSSGSIFGFRSLIGIHPPNQYVLRASLSLDSPVPSESVNDIVVTVKNQTMDVVQGARVFLRCNNGTFSNGLREFNGTTLANGKLTVKWTAPYVPATEQNDTKIGIEVQSAELAGYDSAPSIVDVVVVKPQGATFIRVRADIEPEVLSPGESSTITLHVRNQDNIPLAGATAEAQLAEAGPTSTSFATTNADGVAVLTFEAPGVLLEAKDYAFDIIVTHPQFTSAWTVSGSIHVLKSEEIVLPCCPIVKNWPYIAAAVFVGVGAAIMAYIYFAKPKKK